MLEISADTARRYVMGRGGLWPGRRWRGLDGTGDAMRAMEDLQLDPLVVVARAHDLALHSRVEGYAIDDWATLTYGRREFFEWGGWLAVRPMEELPYFRVLMRREREKGHWTEVEREHHAAIEEMRALLRSGREVSNRSFEMSDRTRIDDYRGRKDSALALHYLWRIGEAMVSRRDRFERVYALTEAVAPAPALREVDEAEADDVLARKAVAAAGLARMAGINTAYVNKLKAGGPGELADWRLRGLADGSLIDVRVEGWRTPQLALGEDAGIIADIEAGRVPAAWAPIGPTTTEEATFLSPLDPVSARGRAKPLFGFDYVWEVYKPSEKRLFGYYTMPILWGDRLVGRFDPKLDRSTGTLMILGLWLEDTASAKDAAFADALATGMRRFMALLGVALIDVTAVSQPTLRRSLARLGRRRRASRSADQSEGAIRSAPSGDGHAPTTSGTAAGRRATTARSAPHANTSAAAPSIATPSPAPTDTKPMSGG
jgi:uncharacterized protein YcaQ